MAAAAITMSIVTIFDEVGDEEERHDARAGECEPREGDEFKHI